MLPYSSVVLVMAVYVFSSVSLDSPQCVVVSAFSIFVVFFALFVVFCICFAKVCLRSNVRPSIFMVLSFLLPWCASVDRCGSASCYTDSHSR